MTDDRSIERAAPSWLEVGPNQAPDHPVEAALLQIQTTSQERDWKVPWRVQLMSPQIPIAAAAALGVIAIGGVLLLLRPGPNGVGNASAAPSPSQTVSPSVTPAAGSSTASQVAIPALDATFTSTFAGYSVRYPSAWPVTPATKPWRTGYDTDAPGIADKLGSVPSFTGTSIALPKGMSYEA
jgi:hypothetical protein